MRDRRRYWGIPGVWALFAGFGTVSIVGGFLAPDPRAVLFALGATGLFAGVLAYLVSPRRVVRASLVDRLHAVLAANLAAHVPGAGWQRSYTYVPVEEAAFGSGSVFLLVTGDGDDNGAGTYVHATGDALLAEFDDYASGELSDSPAELGRQVVDGLTNGLELAGRATCDVEPSEERASIGVGDIVVGTTDDIDDPITSFVGSAFASGLGRPVTVERDDATSSGETVVSCRWLESGQESHVADLSLTARRSVST